MTGSVNSIQAYNYYPGGYYGGENRYASEEKPFTVLNNFTEDKETKTVAAGGFLALAGIALTGISKWCSDKLMAGKEFAGAQESKSVAAAMVKDNKLNVVVDYIDHDNKFKYGPGMAHQLEPVANGSNAFFMDKVFTAADGTAKGLAVAPKSKPSLMLHELGHAINAHIGGVWKAMQKSRAYVGIWAIPALLGLASTAEILRGKNNNNSRKENFIERHAGKLGFLAFLPTIIEEGSASFRGLNAAKKVLGNTAKLGVLKRNYFFAWMTYLIAGAGMGIAARQAFLERK